MTKTASLLDWCKSMGTVSKAQIQQYGVDNFYIRAEREVRIYVERGIMRQFIPEGTLMAWYEWIGAGDVTTRKVDDGQFGETPMNNQSEATQVYSPKANCTSAPKYRFNMRGQGELM